MTPADGPRGLTAIVCGAGPASDVGRLVTAAKDRGWEVSIVATPAALPFLDLQALETQTGRPVRWQPRPPEEGSARSLPSVGGIIVAPATYNTINKWAQGISDNYALGLLAEAFGLGIPVIAIPFVNAALAASPVFSRSVEALRGLGVRVIHGPGEWEPHPPGTGGDRMASFPWQNAPDELESHSNASRRSRPGDAQSVESGGTNLKMSDGSSG